MQWKKQIQFTDSCVNMKVNLPSLSDDYLLFLAIVLPSHTINLFRRDLPLTVLLLVYSQHSKQRLVRSELFPHGHCFSHNYQRLETEPLLYSGHYNLNGHTQIKMLGSGALVFIEIYWIAHP